MAEGTELLGEYQGSGCVEAPFIVRLASGRMVEISPLLHLVAAELAEERDLTDVAATVSLKLGRTISADSVSHLIDRKLRPLGIIRTTGVPPSPKPTAPALGLALHVGVIPNRVVGAIAGFLRPLFLPPVLQ